jgi:TIR domain
MPIFISYSREDSAFVDKLAKNLVMRRHHVWMDRWELNVGDSLIAKIQSALTESSAILIILSKNSVASEWCKKELNSGLMRELDEKKVLVLPCVIDDCEIPLFIREKLYADFRKRPDEAFRQLDSALLRISNRQQGRLESPDFHTDWSYDWKKGKNSGLWYFEWTFVDHGLAIEYCVLTRCQLACNEIASAIFQRLGHAERQDYIRRAFAITSSVISKRHLKIQLR